MTTKKIDQQYSTGWIMLLALFTALGPLSIDMYLPAFLQMAHDFNVIPQMVSNSLPAYFLGLALGQLIYGPLSDRIGRKTPLYFGMAVFALASLLCAFATDVWFLIGARLLQALGGCVGVVIARAAIRDRLDVQGSAQAFSSMMIVMGIAPVMAPIFGAWVLYFFDWQAVFILLMLIGIFCLVCVHFFFTETLPVERRLKLSIRQVGLLYQTILKDKSFRLPMLAGCLTGGALFCYISSASAVFMGVFAMDQQHFAYAFAFNAVGIMFLSSINKRISQRVGIKQRLQMGGLIQFTGAVTGIGFTGPNAMALAMSQQGARAGTASALMGSVQFSSGLLGGLMLNFMPWNALLNMGILMVLFTLLGLTAIFTIVRQQ